MKWFIDNAGPCLKLWVPEPPLCWCSTRSDRTDQTQRCGSPGHPESGSTCWAELSSGLSPQRDNTTPTACLHSHPSLHRQDNNQHQRPTHSMRGWTENKSPSHGACVVCLTSSFTHTGWTCRSDKPMMGHTVIMWFSCRESRAAGSFPNPPTSKKHTSAETYRSTRRLTSAASQLQPYPIPGGVDKHKLTGQQPPTTFLCALCCGREVPWRLL